jgi:SAM-dependent methyltransferase
MPKSDMSRYVESTKAAWDRTSQKYAADVGADIDFLRSGGVGLLDRDARALKSLVSDKRVIHLQCSHGRESLSLLNLGAHEVVGVDLSSQMLDLARQKSDALAAPATWVQAAILQVPAELYGTADIVFTGGGALPWISDISRWAGVVVHLLRPEGVLYLWEGHPLNWVWDVSADSHRLTADARSYFDRKPRANDDFPASAIERFTPDNETPPIAWEYQWNIGDIVTAVSRAGLVIERLTEYPEQFWPKLRDVDEAELARLPHTFTLVARLPRVRGKR